jgi:hypothetical protein
LLLLTNENKLLESHHTPWTQTIFSLRTSFSILIY